MRLKEWPEDKRSRRKLMKLKTKRKMSKKKIMERENQRIK